MIVMKPLPSKAAFCTVRLHQSNIAGLERFDYLFLAGCVRSLPSLPCRGDAPQFPPRVAVKKGRIFVANNDSKSHNMLHKRQTD